METYKLKIKIGVHEFEAEGPQEAVERQFEAFKELVASQPSPPPPKETPPKPQVTPSPPNGGPEGPRGGLRLDAIMRVEGRVVSLTATPQEVGEAALLILLGQKIQRTNDTPTGAEIADGLRQSGYTIRDRVRTILDGFVAEGLVMRIGSGRSTRYRLTNIGIPRAEAIAQQIQNTVA